MGTEQLPWVAAEVLGIPRPPAIRAQWVSYLEDFALAHPDSVDAYREDLVWLERTVLELGLPKSVKGWKETEVQQVRRELTERYAPSTVRKRVAVMNGLLLYWDNPIIEKLRRRGRYKLPSGDRRRVRWTPWEERVALISKATPNKRLILVLAYELGLRREEIRDVQVRDVGRTDLLVRGKGDKEDVVDLIGIAAKEVHHYKDIVRPGIVERARLKGFDGPEPPELLIYCKGSKLKRYELNSITNMIQQYGKSLDIKVSPHDGRRTFADDLYAESGMIKEVQTLLRHRNLSTTEGYIQPDRRRAREALERYYARDRTFMDEARSE